MYPFKVVLIGMREEESSAVRRALANLAIDLTGDFPDPDKAILGKESLTDACVLLVRVNMAQELEHVRRLLRVFPGKPIVVLLNADSDAQALILTQRAGAVQTVFYPPQGEDFQAAFDTLALQFGHSATGSQVIAVCGVTEGAGATSLAINLAYEAAGIHQRSCILTEFSGGMGRLATYLDLEPETSTHDLLPDGPTLELPLVKQALVSVTENWKVLAGPFRAPSSILPAPARVAQLVEHLRRLAAVVVLDLPYDAGPGFLAALTNTDQVLLVGEQTVPSVHDLKIVGEVLGKGASTAVRHVVISRFEAGEEEFTPARLKELLSTERLWTIAADRPAFKAALNEGKPLRQQVPHSRALGDIAALARDLLGIAEPPQQRSGFFSWISPRRR